MWYDFPLLIQNASFNVINSHLDYNIKSHKQVLYMEEIILSYLIIIPYFEFTQIQVKFL